MPFQAGSFRGSTLREGGCCPYATHGLLQSARRALAGWTAIVIVFLYLPIVILDIDMPDRGGLDILRHVRASHPDLRVLVLSGYPEGQYAVQMLRAGAHGYVRKSASPDEIRAAVEAVGSGVIWLPIRKISLCFTIT